MASTTAVAIEEPAYTVDETHAVYEIRSYPAYLVAQTLVSGPSVDASDAGSEGFKILAAYIFGKNEVAPASGGAAPLTTRSARIEMTAPVAQRPDQEGFWVQFTMPHTWTLESLPRPSDPRVQIASMPARRVAVIRYSGFWTQGRYRDALETLEGALLKDGYTWHGEPIWARYDPPWMPWFARRNEIWLELDSPHN